MAFDPSERELLESLGIGTAYGPDLMGTGPAQSVSDFEQQYQDYRNTPEMLALRQQWDAEREAQRGNSLLGNIYRFAAPLALPFAAPAVGAALGLGSGITAGIGGGAALGATLAGVNRQDPLRGAALGGLSGGLGSLGTAVPSESLVSAVPATVPATIPETLAGAIQNPLLRGAVQGSLNTGAVAAANEIVGDSRTPPYIPPGQGTVPERVVIEARVPVPGPGMEDFPIVLGDVQDILDVIRGGGARPPTPQFPTVSAPTPGGVAEEVLGIPSEVIEEVLGRIPSGGGGGGAPQEGGAPVPPVPGEAEDEAARQEARRRAEEAARRRAEEARRRAEEAAEAERQRQAEAERQRQAEAERQRQAEEAQRRAEETARQEAAPPVEETPSPGVEEEPMPPGTAQDEEVIPGTQQPEPDLGSAMGLMGLLAQPGESMTLESGDPAEIKLYDLENLFGVSGMDQLYNLPFRDELTFLTDELLEAARERR